MTVGASSNCTAKFFRWPARCKIFPDADQEPLSFHLAGSLPLDLDFKQKLLAMRSESERFIAVAAYLEGILPELRRAARAGRKPAATGTRTERRELVWRRKRASYASRRIIGESLFCWGFLS